MQRDLTLVSDGRFSTSRGLPAGLNQAPLVLLIAISALIALTARDWADMAGQWWNSSTYGHILLIPIVLAWLVWQRRQRLAELTPRAWWPGLAIIGGALFLWFLGSISGLNLLCQTGALLALQGTVVTLLGVRIAGVLLFPLAYSLFLIPFGDELVPALQMITARITIELTGLSGVPASVDGVFIDTPVGLFEVAEACSGVKFLVAMVPLGTLAAHVCFSGAVRRTVFMFAALSLPILANGVRAWGTIYIAQFQGIEFAASFDHILYGWIFFALVVTILLAGAWRFFDRDPLERFSELSGNKLIDRAETCHCSMRQALAGLLLLCGVFALWSWSAHRLNAALPDRIELPDVQGWHRIGIDPDHWWEPRAGGANHRLLGRYADADGHQVDVFVALFASQDSEQDAGAFGEGAVAPDSEWRWLGYGEDRQGARSDHLLAEGHLVRIAETSYRTGDVLTGSTLHLKLANMRDRMLMRENSTIMLILSAEDDGPKSASESLSAFRASVGDIGEWMDRIAKGS